jgi:hypothetical protein
MAAIAHDPKFAAKVGVPQKVGQEYNQADKGTPLLKQAMQVQALRQRNAGAM